MNFEKIGFVGGGWRKNWKVVSNSARIYNRESVYSKKHQTPKKKLSFVKLKGVLSHAREYADQCYGNKPWKWEYKWSEIKRDEVN